MQARACHGCCWGVIQWREERIRSLDGTSIALCISEISTRGSDALGGSKAKTPVYILYFQGNASSLPPRLPDISWVLRHLVDAHQEIDFTTVCLSYRGYWKSHDRPSERGINMDAQAAFQWISQRHRGRAAGEQLAKPVMVLWGQSIGCGFATNLAAMPRAASDLSIDAMVLETPFTNTRAMLTALYPQRWLPYRHLWPFLRNHLDSWKNLGVIAGLQQTRPPQVYIVEAAKDELVPREHGTILRRRCQDLGLVAERFTIRGALHNDVMVRRDGKQAIAQAIGKAVSRAGDK
ncbi:alpha/beta-hydrolase [Ophiocordyceps sinensis CO18]|uniref:Alpha/beta-hydrolase n=1 Tax=Ophiocordyceps sinensis (strain Co18 / CGMCC 3.14243) TaxID=911162 RepID=T5AJL3_OPHSC|nr:alpha/beta-hydrolase [Ophiocordyceps sinensis CO18]